MFRWKLRGTVSFIYPIRRFHGHHGQGELFLFDVKDDSSEISVISYNEQCENFRNLIVKGIVMHMMNGINQVFSFIL